MRTLVLGGARSGKSGVAESLVGDAACVYVATARPLGDDPEFAQRIERHRVRRPQHWVTEDERDLICCLRDHREGTMLVDDLGTWLTARIDQAQAWEDPEPVCEQLLSELLEALEEARGDVIIVSPEVGMSVVPEYRSARRFRDAIGTMNQSLAQVCDQVLLVVAGLTLELKR